MALGSNSLNATIAKLRAVYGKRLRDTDYSALMAKKTVSEIAEYLKTTPFYHDALANIDVNTIHRGHLELILRRNLFDSCQKFCKFQLLDRQEFYRFQLVHVEIRELLRAILYLNAGSGDDFIAATPAYLIDCASYPVLELGKAKSFSDVLRLLAHTPYQHILADVPVGKDGRVDYTQCEIRLRTYYLKWLLEIVSRDFRGEDRKALAQQIEIQVDLINIINAYRMKTFFHADAQTLNAAMLPFRGRLNAAKMQALYDTHDTDEFMKLLRTTIYGAQLNEHTGELTPAQFERELSKLRCNLARRSLTLSENAAVSIYSMMFLLENEMNNIITIIEAIRYGKSIPYIESLLVIS